MTAIFDAEDMGEGRHLIIEENLPPLSGTAKEIGQAMSIRLEQVQNLTILKCLVPPTSIFAPIAHACISRLINCQQAASWIEVRDVDFSVEWLKGEVASIIIQGRQEFKRTGTPMEWVPPPYDFVDFLPELVGTRAEVLQATELRREQAVDLLRLKCEVKPASAGAARTYALIDSLLNRDRANEWVETQSALYDGIWLLEVFPGAEISPLLQRYLLEELE